jgi:hypothetical protein
MSLTNGSTTRIVAHHIGGTKDGTADVIEKSNPLVGPNGPKPQPPSTPPDSKDSKPKSETTPEKNEKEEK